MRGKKNPDKPSRYRKKATLPDLGDWNDEPLTKSQTQKRGYKKEYAAQAYKLTLLGARLSDMADFFGVSERAVDKWMNERPEFSAKVKEARIIADAEVAESLYKLATGFIRDEIELKVVSDGGGVSVVEQVPVKRYYPPNVKAALTWLKNRHPDKWKDRMEVKHEGPEKEEVFIIAGQKIGFK